MAQLAPGDTVPATPSESKKPYVQKYVDELRNVPMAGKVDQATNTDHEDEDETSKSSRLTGDIVTGPGARCPCEDKKPAKTLVNKCNQIPSTIRVNAQQTQQPALRKDCSVRSGRNPGRLLCGCVYLQGNGVRHKRTYARRAKCDGFTQTRANSMQNVPGVEITRCPCERRFSKVQIKPSQTFNKDFDDIPYSNPYSRPSHIILSDDYGKFPEVPLAPGNDVQYIDKRELDEVSTTPVVGDRDCDCAKRQAARKNVQYVDERELDAVSTTPVVGDRDCDCAKRYADNSDMSRSVKVPQAFKKNVQYIDERELDEVSTTPVVGERECDCVKRQADNFGMGSTKVQQNAKVNTYQIRNRMLVTDSGQDIRQTDKKTNTKESNLQTDDVFPWVYQSKSDVDMNKHLQSNSQTKNVCPCVYQKKSDVDRNKHLQSNSQTKNVCPCVYQKKSDVDRNKHLQSNSQTKNVCPCLYERKGHVDRNKQLEPNLQTKNVCPCTYTKRGHVSAYKFVGEGNNPHTIFSFNKENKPRLVPKDAACALEGCVCASDPASRGISRNASRDRQDVTTNKSQGEGASHDTPLECSDGRSDDSQGEMKVQQLQKMLHENSSDYHTPLYEESQQNRDELPDYWEIINSRRKTYHPTNALKTVPTNTERSSFRKSRSRPASKRPSVQSNAANSELRQNETSFQASPHKTEAHQSSLDNDFKEWCFTNYLNSRDQNAPISPKKLSRQSEAVSPSKKQMERPIQSRSQRQIEHQQQSRQQRHIENQALSLSQRQSENQRHIENQALSLSQRQSENQRHIENQALSLSQRQSENQRHGDNQVQSHGTNSRNKSAIELSVKGSRDFDHKSPHGDQKYRLNRLDSEHSLEGLRTFTPSSNSDVGADVRSVKNTASSTHQENRIEGYAARSRSKQSVVKPSESRGQSFSTILANSDMDTRPSDSYTDLSKPTDPPDHQWDPSWCDLEKEKKPRSYFYRKYLLGMPPN
ncbi:hypothetical protein EGW08_022915, partial [Elysia chlorotica]